MVKLNDINKMGNFATSTLNRGVGMSQDSTVLNDILSMPIEEFGFACDLNGRNYQRMLYLMNINIHQMYEITYNKGDYAVDFGDSTHVTTDKQSPTYTIPMDYVVNFQNDIGRDEQDGLNSTRSIASNTGRDHLGSYHNINQIYQESENLFPDEENTGTFYNKWEITKDRSILDVTKKLFDCHKINTIISSFHTYIPNEQKIKGNGDSVSDFGKSHGRNLLTYEAETRGMGYNVNGYENPYCRVWTHHHKYDRMNRLIRPFVTDEENVTPNNETNNWESSDEEWKNVKNYQQREFSVGSGVTKQNFKINDLTKPNRGWGWRNKEGSKGRKLSVLNDTTGFLNIAPQYKGGGSYNIHTKDCMFSIENLAWQGYDPYSFENALSWEQRGPFGGRIMWFPPYGLTFNEDVSVNWNEQQFIGRGENVYTYTNTSRSGTLNFMMVIDHPSIIDYATWYRQDADASHRLRGENNSLTDTDLLRYFAGCDSGKDNDTASLKNKTKPTPLTDEYRKDDEVTEVEEVPIVESPKEDDNIEPTEPVYVTFYVFFPNNYSGYYDRTKENVEGMAYLLAGNGAQWRCNPDNVAASAPLLLSFSELKPNGRNQGKGYEMKGSGSNVGNQNQTNNFIIGTNAWLTYKDGSKYNPDTDKKWYYRIDGEYKVEKTKTGQYKNTFDQELLNKSNTNYRDTQSFGLNCNVESVRKGFTSEKDNEYLYSFAEIAYVLAENLGSVQEVIKERSTPSINTDSDRMKRLKELLNSEEDSVYRVTEINAVGYSSSHANNASKTINNDRNLFLAEERANSVIDWFRNVYGRGSTTIQCGNVSAEPARKVDTKDSGNVSGFSAKLWRSARITLKVERTECKTSEDVLSQSDTNNNDSGYQQFIGFTFHEDKSFPNGGYYINNNKKPIKDANGNVVRMVDDNRKWVLIEKNGIKEMKVYNGELRGRSSGYHNDNKYLKDKGYNLDNGEEWNSLRYDQEYYFFKQLEKDHNTVYNSLVKKLGYFIPAYHSMTPEGFTGRLTFLQQCTRQGNTISTSDRDGKTANNLAFGRPPFCILRLGDFYYQKIVIKNISISYDPLVLDLNSEGAGVVPLIANVSISFNFIGGGDLSGPVRRLQNAMSFNYYANTRLYDNRADRMNYNYSQETNGAINHDLILDGKDKSYFYNTKMNKN